MTMGEKILSLRKARGWSQEELAEKVGVTRQAVSRWESSSAKPDADKIIAICDLFGVSADYLLRDDYRGEIAMGASKKPEMSAKERWGRWLTFAGSCGILVLMILESAFPRGLVVDTYYNEYGNLQPVTVDGMRGFLMWYSLEWLFFLLLGCLFLGLVLIWKGNKALRDAVYAKVSKVKTLLDSKRKGK